MDSINPQAPSGDRFGRFGVKLYRYKALIIRRWWILAITVGIGLAMQWWGTYKKPRLFESTSQLNIREELSLPTQVTKVESAESFIGTNLAMLKSPEIVERARRRVALEAPDVKGEVPSLSTSVVPRTSIFLITGSGPDPLYTQKFVDAAVLEFIEFRREQRDRTIGSVSDDISNVSQRLQKELDEQRAKLKEFIAKNNMPFWTEQARSSAAFLSGLKTRQAALQTELQRLKDLTPDQLLVIPPPAPAPAAPAGAGSELSSSGGGMDSMAGSLYPVYTQKAQELSMAQARLQERSKIWKPKHPKLMRLKEEVAQIERAMAVIKEQNREATSQRQEAIKAELGSLEQSISTWNAKVLEASSKDTEYQALQENVTRAVSALDRVKDSGQAVKSNPSLDVFMLLQTASPAAEVPRNMTKNLITGAIGGLILGLVILILLDRTDDRINSSSEVMDHFSESILGQIPNVADSRGESGLPLLQPDDERYTFAESFRSLRSSLIFLPNLAELKTVLVTSAIPNEGKSTIASNLAITMAAGGANVIVVDADLRRGDLASLFDADGRTGLSNILRSEVPWKTAVQKTRYPSLSLIPRGPVTGQSSELLLLPTMDKMLEEMKSEYDLVVFNTAPILATDDTPTIAPHFDGSLMVMRAQFTSKRLTKNALNALYQRQVNVLGLILNCVDTEMPDYYYYRYPKYYAAQ